MVFALIPFATITRNQKFMNLQEFYLRTLILGLFKEVLLSVEGRCDFTSLCNSLPCIQPDKGKRCGLVGVARHIIEPKAISMYPNTSYINTRKTSLPQILMNVCIVRGHPTESQCPHISGTFISSGGTSIRSQCPHRLRTFVSSIKLPSPSPPPSASQLRL